MSKFVGTGPSSYEKRIYRAAVSQRLRNTGVDHAGVETELACEVRVEEEFLCCQISWYGLLAQQPQYCVYDCLFNKMLILNVGVFCGQVLLLLNLLL